METSRGELAEPAMFRRGDAIDRFTVLELLGMGGMGVVVSAYDSTLDRKVAIKVLRPERLALSPEESRTRLLREAQAMARLNHPNVITVHEVGTVGDQVFVAMELIEGDTLAGWLAGASRPWREVVQTFERAGRGLAAAHRAGLVHRDFKPENVLVGAGDEVRVTDFGLASVSAGSPAAEAAVVLAVPLTRTGTVMGTPAYMSPEQHRGEEADARSDQFSFCVALYEGLCGVRPFAGDTVEEVFDAIMAGRLSEPQREAPRWLRPLVLRGLQARPEDRWPGMDALLDALESVPRRRRRIRLGVGLAAAGAAVAAALVLARTARVPADACASAAADVDAVWGAAERGQLRAAFAKSGRPLAADTAQRIERRFDAWTRRWRDTRVDICRRVGTGELATSAAQRRTDCVGRQLDQLRARVALVTEGPSGDVVDRAVELAVLPETAECAELGEGNPLPSDPEKRAPILAAFRQVDQLDTERARLHGRGLTDRAAELVGEAERLDWPPLANYARAVAATVAEGNGDCKKALELASAVAESAPAEGQTRLAAEMWNVRISCFRDLDDTAGLDHALLASRALVRQLRGSLAAVKLQVEIGAAEEARGRLDAAEQVCRAAAAAAEQLPPDSATGASAQLCLASIYSHQGKNAEALAAAEAALAASERAVGPDHPDIAMDLRNVGIGYQRVGRYRDAVDAKRRALAIEERFWGADHLRVAVALQSLGWGLVRLGEEEEAHRNAMRALAIVERTPPSARGDLILYYLLAAETSPARDHGETDRLYERARALCDEAGPEYAWDCVGVHDNYAVALRERGECTRALALVDQAMKRMQSIEGIEPSASASLLALRGECLSQLGRHRGAVADLERALGLLDSDVPPDDTASVKYSLGRALAAAGQSRPRAFQLLRDARALYVQAGAGHDEEIQKVDRALAELGSPR